MIKKTIKDKYQEIADKVQAKLGGFDRKVNLHEQIADKDERIQKLEAEAKHWHEKYDAMYKAWHGLAIATKGAEAAEQMAKQIGNE